MPIDSHHHFWKFDPAAYRWISEEMPVLRQDFGPDELRAQVERVGIDRVVSVQAQQSVEETRWLLQLADQCPLVAGVVGWVPLASVNLAEALDELGASPWLKGVRHVVQDEPDEEFILGSAFNRGVASLASRSLVYDILIYARHLPNAIAFIDRHPHQSFVLDHIAKPTISAAAFDSNWAHHLRELARRDHVVCKFSGVATEVRESPWSLATIQPYWDVALEAFGVDRLMFGSDWPVCLLRTEYERWFTTVQQLAAPLSADEQARILGGNAIRIYGLDAV